MNDQRKLFELDDRLWRGNTSNFTLDNPIEATAYFAEGFHLAAKAVITARIKESGRADLEAMPIVFLYRHAIELALKSFVWNGDEIASTLGKIASNSKGPTQDNHDLCKLLGFANHIRAELSLDWPSQAITWPEAMRFISELGDADPSSDSFRYPVSRKGAPSPRADLSFNVYRFAALLDPVVDGLRDWNFRLEDLRN